MVTNVATKSIIQFWSDEQSAGDISPVLQVILYTTAVPGLGKTIISLTVAIVRFLPVWICGGYRRYRARKISRTAVTVQNTGIPMMDATVALLLTL